MIEMTSRWSRVLTIGAAIAAVLSFVALVVLSGGAQTPAHLAASTPARHTPRSASVPSRPPRATAVADTHAVMGPTIMGRDTAKVITFNREVFRYEVSGHRDPFVSLMKSSDIRPLFTDLRLTTIAYDASGRNSVAVLRDLTGKEQYRVRVGSPIGRMRVTRIDQRAVTFLIEEFGYSRQETLSMSDSTGSSTRTRTP